MQRRLVVLEIIPVSTLTIYTKPNCPLCDKALEQIEQARRRVSFELIEVNILDNPEDYERFKHAIPVIALDGMEIFRYRLTCAELLRKLAAASRATSTASHDGKGDRSQDAREGTDSGREPQR